MHLIIHFPLTIPGESPIIELPSDAGEETPLSLEWVQNINSPFANIPGGTRLQMEASTINPAHITLANIHPHSDMHHRIRKRPRRAEKPLHFQPPALSFYPLSKVPIAVTLANSLIRKAVHCFIKPDENGEVSVEDIWSRISANADSPVFGNIRWRSVSRSWLFPSDDGETTAATRPIGPSGPQIGPILSQPLPESTFPLTTFDIFAQGSRRQIVCSVTWDAMAHPSGQVSLANGEQEQNEISWDLGDVLKSKVSSAARTIHWVNYAPPRKFVPLEINSGDTESDLIDEEHQNQSLQYTKFTSSSATSRRKSGRYWMLHPPRLLPAPFFPTEYGAGHEDVFFHVPHPKTELLNFFARIHRKLGFPEDKVQEIIYHWGNLLPSIEQRSAHGVIVKFLQHKELSKIFPVEIEPMPADFRRAFAVVWTLKSDEAWEIQQRESEEVRITKVAQGICAHGRSPRGVSLEGFKVFEWGGIVVPYSSDEDCGDDQGSESGSGSDTASDRTIRAPSSSFSDDDVMMEDVASSHVGEEPDTPMGNDVDAVVLGDEGMYIVMRS